MTFLEHLEALRWHLVRSAIAVVVCMVVAFMNKSFLFDTIIFGPRNADFPTYRVLCYLSEKLHVDMCITDFNYILINVAMAGQFTMHIWVSFIAGLVVSFPYILWELWKFIKPALSEKEKSYSQGVVFYCTALFFAGVLFGYYVIGTMSINFLGTYTVSEQVKNQISLDSYISTISFLTFASGVIFELPMVIYFLSKIGIITPQFMRKYRKHAMVIILIIAAIITPSPDVSSQLLVAVPLFLLYEISIFVSAYVIRKSASANLNSPS